ncbi:MAG: T9SS type A sorting domain-containing protein, partial [Bacteroidales bacterium]|nr:T9SS type A sorting domain-containing protein [Bacteroidales bacterium]
YNSTPNIVNNNFANNLGSLRILQSLNAKVSNNNFDGNLNFTPQTSNEPYSCYIAGNGVSNALLSFKNNTIQNGNIGVQFYNTGPNATSVSHNNFININETAQSCAATVIGKNSDYIENSGINKGDIGLEFRCNNFANSSYAIAVIDGNMCKYQGKNNALVGEDYAGNGFDHYGTNSERDFYVKIPIASHLDIPLYIYYSHADDEHKIIYYTSSKVYNVIRPLFYDEEDCAVDDNGGIILPGFKLNSGNDLIEDIDTEIMLKEYELLELTDNGQTYMLISKVESMNNLNSTKIADDIASLSGYISDELAISLIQNNEANQFAKANALIANSPLPINVKYHIDNMDMNIALKQHIKNHQNGVNPRNIKEAEIAQLKQHRSYIVSQMYDHAINNDSTPSEQQALEEFLINDKDINSKIYLFNFYKHNNNYEYAAITLNSIKSNLENNDLNYEMENYLSLEKIILDIEFEKTNLIDAVQNNLELINFIASNESHLGQVSAQLLLHDAGITEYNENIKLPEPALLTKNSRLEHKVEQLYKYNDIINIYPNPSKDVFYIEYALFDNEQDLTIQIISIDGTVIDNIKLNQNIGVFVYNKQLSAGIYTVKVGNKFVRKIVINN